MSAATVMPAASSTRRPRKAAAKTAPPAMPTDSPAARLIPLVQLDSHPDNPRVDLTDIEQLADNIREVGLLQALLVVPTHRLFGLDGLDDGRYTIVAGHRRHAAVAHLGWTEVRCEVDNQRDARSIRAAMLAENMQRVDLTPLEQAEYFDKLVGDGWSQRDIAAAAGCTQGQVSKRLSLLRLEPTVQQAVRDEQLPVADAVEIGKLATPRSQKRAYERMRGLHGHGMKRSVLDAISDEQRAVAQEETYEQACAQVKASGWPRVTNRPSYDKAETLYRAPEQKAHQKGPLPCYAVYVETNGGISHYCTKPSAHRGKAKDTSPQAEKERRDKRERKRAMEARAAAAAMLATVAVGRDEVLEQLTDLAFAGWIHSGAAGFATEWLRAGGWSGLPSDPFAARQFVARSADEKLRSRFLGALLLGHCEAGARELHRRWGSQEALYLHRLTLRTGYSYGPTEWERERLREQCGILDVDAFLAAIDPTAHLSGQPTLHDDLGTEPATTTVDVSGDLL